MLLVNDEEQITEQNSRDVKAYKYDEEMKTITLPVRLLNFLRFDPYWEDPSESDLKRTFELTDDKKIIELT